MPPNTSSPAQETEQQLRKRVSHATTTTDKLHILQHTDGKRSTAADGNSSGKKQKVTTNQNLLIAFACIAGCLIYFYLIPNQKLIRHLLQLKHQLTSIQELRLRDVRPIDAKAAIPLEEQKTGGNEDEVYEYHQFMATVEQHFPNISLHEVPCRYDGYAREIERNAAPQRCGTLIFDDMIDVSSVKRLREMSRKYCNVIGDTNYHNRESYNLRWINLHHLFKYGPEEGIFDDSDYELIRNTSEAVKNAVCSTFGLPPERTYFSPVSQFTRYHPVVPYSEFRHVDKVRSPYLIVTTILWLSTVDVDFTGGRTEFLTGGPEPLTPLLIEPKFGRFAAWTSGWENPHGVFEVESGERLALIFAFTVHDDIGHPNLNVLREWALAEVPDRTLDQKRSAAEAIASYDGSAPPIGAKSTSLY